MVKAVKDHTGKWHVGDSPGAHPLDGTEHERVFKLAMKTQKAHNAAPLKACNPSAWLDERKPEWVADRAPFVDCWNFVNENCNCKEVEMFQSSMFIFMQQGEGIASAHRENSANHRSQLQPKDCLFPFQFGRLQQQHESIRRVGLVRVEKVLSSIQTS